MNNLTTYQELIEQRNKMNKLEKEEYEEKAHMYMIANKNKSDILRTDEGEKKARKLMNRLNNFYKSIEKSQLNDKFLLINIEQTTEHFKAYLLERVKGKEKEEYEIAFKEKSFQMDVMNLVRQKMYEHKQEMELNGDIGFLSPEAKCLSSIALVMKSIRSSSHESTGRIAKVTLTMLDGSKEKLTDEQLEQITPLIEKVCDELVMKEINNILKVDFLSQKLISGGN